MSEALQRVLAALRAGGKDPLKSGEGYTCCCPAHDDKNPSLSICELTDGVGLKCHAGCTFGAIVDALGLEQPELFHDFDTRTNTQNAKQRFRTREAGAPKPRAKEDDASPAYSSVQEAIEALERHFGTRSNQWTYQNALGETVLAVVRFDGRDGKSYRPVSRSADGKAWRVKGMPAPRPLYGLPALLAAPAGSTVYVCEGEKSADAARALGFLATTSPHGAKSAKEADWSTLRGHDVVVLADHDDAGEDYAADVVELCASVGAKSVRIVRLVELWDAMPKGGDVVDLLEHRGGEVESLRTDISALAERTAPEEVALETLTSDAFVPFPTHLLPQHVWKYVSESAGSIGCDPSFVALPMLCGLAAAIGTTHCIELKRGWTEPAILWAAINGESGTAKSPALELALRPFCRQQCAAMKEHAQRKEQFAIDLEEFERELARWRKSKSDTAPPTKPAAPILKRSWTDETTVESIAEKLTLNPRGLLMKRDELSGWFNFDRYTNGKGGGDVARYLEMHGGRPLLVDRKGIDPLYVARAALSITGGIQPQTLRRELRTQYVDNGLSARLLFASPPRRPKRWTDTEVSRETEARVDTVFDRLFALTPDTTHDGERPHVLTLDDDAKRAFVEFVNVHGKEQMKLHGADAAAWSKLEGYAARFALIFHLTRAASNDPNLRNARRVDLTSIQAGIELSRWFGNEAKRVHVILAESDGERSRREILELIQRMGGETNARKLRQYSRQFATVPDAEAALESFVAAGIGTWRTLESGSRGRPKGRRFILNTQANPLSTVLRETAEISNTVDVDM